MAKDTKTPERKARGYGGFAALTPERRREISSLGGVAAHVQGKAHEWTRETAAIAGKKGGTISRGGRGRLVQATEIADAPRPGSRRTR